MSPMHQVLNRQQAPKVYQSASNSREFGDSISNSTKNSNVIRYSFQNIRGFGTHHKHERSLAIKDFMETHQIDVMGMAEVNQNWRNLRRTNTLEQICRKWFEQTRSMTSYNSHNRERGYSLPGGVGSITRGPLALRALERHHDKRQMGRWGSQLFQGKKGKKLRFVSVYVPHVAKDHGDKKIFCQQQDVLLKLKVPGSVIKNFWQDFWDQVDEWLGKGEQLVIGGDWNEIVTEKKFLKPFLDRNLKPAVQTRHGTKLPATYNRGSKPLDEVFCSSTLEVQLSGYGIFGQTRGDHRPVWLDISTSSALGTSMTKLSNKQPKRLRCKDPRIVKKYNYVLRQQLDKHGAFHRAHRLLQTFHTPLTKQEEKEFEKLDKIRVAAMKTAEKQCRKLRMGKYEWTPALQALRDKIRYLRLSLSRKKGSYVGARLLINLSKKVKLCVLSWSITKIEKELYETTGTFRKMRKNHVQDRISYLDDLAIALAKEKKTTKAAMVKQLQHTENQRATFRRLAQVNNKIAALSTNFITVKNKDGESQEITDPKEMDKAFKQENQRKYHQTEDTCPFLKEPLKSDFGEFGQGPETDNLLAGQYNIPSHLSPETKEFLELCKIHDENAITKLDRSVDEFKASWKHMREDTGTGTIHFGHFKASTFHSTNLLFHYALAEIPFRSGYTPSRWKSATNVMILKKEGITDIDRLRTIVLFEADYNHNNKYLGRHMMKHCGQHSFLAKEQYSVPGKKCIDHVINRRLTFDIVRQQKISMAMGSVDLASCYDRVAHSPAYLAMRGFGIPSGPIASMFETYQNTQFHSKSVHGKSKITFGGLEDGFSAKPQGMGQGNGAGPPVWAIVSSRMFQILKKRNLVAKFSRPISAKELELCGFAFVDDSDIIATSNNVNDPQATITKMQHTLDAWEAAAKVTGGALEPNKSYGYLIYFKWKDGKWCYGPLDDDHILTAEDKNNNRVAMKMKQSNEALKMLGVHLAPDGNQKEQFRYMYKKALQFGEYMRCGSVKRDESFLALKSIAMKSIEYPLPATSLSEKQLSSIMWQILQHYLPKSGINRYIPRDVLYAPLTYQGLGVQNPFIIQGCKHIHDMVEHLHKNSITGQLIATSLEHLRIEMGSNVPIMSTDPSLFAAFHLTDSWVMDTWKFCHEQGITVEDKTPSLPMLRENDKCIMDEFRTNKHIAPKSLQVLNRCRLYLRAFSLSDISTGDGKAISTQAWKGVYDGATGRKGELWPQIPPPSSANWKTWREALRVTFCSQCNRQLDSPLRHWVEESEHKWYIQPTTKTLFATLEDGSWRLYKCNTVRTRSLRFTNTPICTNPPDKDHIVPTTVYKEANYIYAEGFSPAVFRAKEDRAVSTPTWLFETRCQNGKEDDIALALQNGTGIAVSDGSYKEELGQGASASIIANRTTTASIQVTSIVPGEAEIQNAYRSELTGLLASLQLIHDTCIKYHITKGSCTVVCDGKGALHKIFSTTKERLKPSTEHADLIAACTQLIDKIPIQLYPQHVKAHQEEVKLFHELSDFEKLNVLMDYKAKQALKHNPYSDIELQQLPQHPLSYHQILHEGRIQRFNFSNALYNSIYKKRSLNHWIKINRFHQNQNHIIDWQAQAKAIKEIKPSRQRFISKWSADYIGTGANLVDWQQRHHGNCPYCDHKNETTEHVLLCRSTEAQDRWNEAMQKYKDKLKLIKTNRLVRNVIETELHYWRNQLHPPDITVLPLDLQKTITQQRKLGWKNFLEGILTKEWASIQRRYKPSTYGYSKSRIWIKKLIKLNWIFLQQIWTDRNDKLHNTQTVLDREGHQELLRAIEQEWKIGLHRLPIREFAYLFQIKWKQLQQKSTSYLKSWFVKVRLGRELHQDSKLITDEFSEQGPLRRWAGLEVDTRREKELIKAIKKEQKLGISKLPSSCEELFKQKDMHTDKYSIEDKRLWLKTIRMNREKVDDPKGILDCFSVQGPLRKWLGLSN